MWQPSRKRHGVCHVAVTSSEFTSHRLLKRIWPSSVTSVNTIMKLPFRVFALCHSLRRMASLPLSFYGGLKFMRLFRQTMHTSTAEKLLPDHTSVACMYAFAHLNFSWQSEVGWLSVGARFVEEYVVSCRNQTNRCWMRVEQRVGQLKRNEDKNNSNLQISL